MAAEWGGGGGFQFYVQKATGLVTEILEEKGTCGNNGQCSSTALPTPTPTPQISGGTLKKAGAALLPRSTSVSGGGFSLTVSFLGLIAAISHRCGEI